MDDAPWMPKADFCRAVGRSDRTVDLWVKAGRAERQVLDGRAYFRLAARNGVTGRNAVTPRNEDVTAPALRDALREMTAELRGLREEVAALRAALPPPAAGRNGSQRRNGRVGWWNRFLYGSSLDGR